MKTLSVKQPWAYLICSGIKDIENRTWSTKFRGRVLIHSSAAKARFNFTWLQHQRLNELNLRRWYDREQTKSAIIGSVEIVDCVLNHPSIWAEGTISKEYPVYNWVLANPILFDKPIENVKGKLSFWEFTGTIPDQIASQ